MTDLLARSENIWQALVPRLPSFTVEVLPEIDSTNTELMRRARDGLLDPVLLVAERQTAGRGRLGRGWHSRPGQSLTFSLGLPMAPASWSGLSLVAGISLAEHLHPDVRLKWPNDLWLQQRKLGGILVETATHTGNAPDAAGRRLVVVGVGINIARPDASALPPTSTGAVAPPLPPAGLAEVLMGITAGETLERVAVPLVHDLLRFETDGFAGFQNRFARLDALAGRTVRLSDGGEGQACGVDAEGALLLDCAGVTRRITSAEVSVRPC
ncbi:MAG TPA: biotin--[acetyl-CoA-carboxylase] ligase [Hydrogenophaga sp.]|uniref:biotin--[acetyl-CoA-carboxylase] ligase n=1 Tax=Hydrogenophaga sp. TaxID=1904254 RepID=UPI002CDF5A24|nr:biotin--[acetyl-CoA-carboxylase] ligase [Hydrogenophaga sp.]HMN92045.1 biotin--[acetyl-CoA-carboxylase] ligase [Hydrogenophaga sp.]HMP08846.1 biotin--[acetyl-CoA-carboxylase] ligase [Hydrogenophaga sp.]